MSRRLLRQLLDRAYDAIGVAAIIFGVLAAALLSIWALGWIASWLPWPGAIK